MMMMIMAKEDHIARFLRSEFFMSSLQWYREKIYWD